MSKGKARRFRVALAMRKRNPEAWFSGPVAVTKAKKNQVVLQLPEPAKNRGGRGGDA